jgi:hypothetical protein
VASAQPDTSNVSTWRRATTFERGIYSMAGLIVYPHLVEHHQVQIRAIKATMNQAPA